MDNKLITWPCQSSIALVSELELSGAIGGLIIPYIPDEQCYLMKSIKV